MEFFKKRSTAWATLTLVIIFSFFIGQAKQPADKIEILPSGVYVQDNANILSDSTEEFMTRVNNGLVSQLGAEIQVVTINTVGGQDIFETAIDVGVQTNLSANSCVFLIAADDADAVIVQGNDLIYAFSDDELTYILQSNFSMDDFDRKTLDQPAKNAFTDLLYMYENYYNVTIKGSANIEYVVDSDDYDMFAIIIFILFILLLVAIVSAPRKRRTVITPVGGTTVIRTGTGNYPPRGSYQTPPRYTGSSSTRGNSRTGGFGSSSRGGSFSSSSRSSSSGSSFSGSSRSGGFGSSSRGGSFRSGSGSSRGGGFRK